jgi:antitoxin (DNA-binding transcriptional repressor) of toxin-antitoxin stability system
MSLNILKIEEQIPQIISKVEAGEEVIIEKSGEPIAKIIPFGKKGKRKLGRERGKIWMSEDFTDPLPKELLKEFYK